MTGGEKEDDSEEEEKGNEKGDEERVHSWFDVCVDDTTREVTEVAGILLLQFLVVSGGKMYDKCPGERVKAR